MNLIIIRGLPGTGKTCVSEILKKIIPGSYVIHIDEFKTKAMKKGRGFEEAKKISYEETIKKLKLLQYNYIILEEILCEKIFFERLLNFCFENEVETYWFRLMRPLNKLLEIESGRKREIKNNAHDLSKLKADLEKIKIKNEHWIKNDSIPLAIKNILNIVFNEC